MCTDNTVAFPFEFEAAVDDVRPGSCWRRRRGRGMRLLLAHFYTAIEPALTVDSLPLGRLPPVFHSQCAHCAFRGSGLSLNPGFKGGFYYNSP